MRMPILSRVCYLLLLLLLQCSNLAVTSLHARCNFLLDCRYKPRHLAAASHWFGGNRTAATAAAVAAHTYLPTMRLPASGSVRAVAAALTPNRLLRQTSLHYQQQLQPQRTHRRTAVRHPSLARRLRAATRIPCLGWQQPKQLLGCNSCSSASRCSIFRPCSPTRTQATAKGSSSNPDPAAATSATVAVDAAAHASLCSRITELSRAYYSGEEPMASDEEFDALWLQLRKLEQVRSNGRNNSRGSSSRGSRSGKWCRSRCRNKD